MCVFVSISSFFVNLPFRTCGECLSTKHVSKATLPSTQLLSAPLHPIPAFDPLTIEFALDVRRDPQLCTIPETIHLTREVFGELG